VFPWPGDRPWNFVLHDGAHRRVDLHLYEPAPDDALLYGSALGAVAFPAAALTGRGRIAGQSVTCEAPEWSLQWHTGYPPRAADHHDVRRLCHRFNLPLPEDFSG
jgi:lincosamide nucleotidyltransferase A/C/D/E